jgi:hypothetical protein
MPPKTLLEKLRQEATREKKASDLDDRRMAVRGRKKPTRIIRNIDRAIEQSREIHNVAEQLITVDTDARIAVMRQIIRKNPQKYALNQFLGKVINGVPTDFIGQFFRRFLNQEQSHEVYFENWLAETKQSIANLPTMQRTLAKLKKKKNKSYVQIEHLEGRIEDASEIAESFAEKAEDDDLTMVDPEAVEVALGIMQGADKEEAYSQFLGSELAKDPELDRDDLREKFDKRWERKLKREATPRSHSEIVIKRGPEINVPLVMLGKDAPAERRQRQVVAPARNRVCEAEFKHYRWIDGKPHVVSVWIAGDNIDKYTIDNEQFKHDGVTYSLANVKFTELQCNFRNKSQTGDMLTVYDGDKPVNVRVLIKERRGPVHIQGEDLFSKERKFFATKSGGVHSRIMSILSSTIDETVRTKVRESLQTAFMSLENDDNAVYVDALENSIYELSIDIAGDKPLHGELYLRNASSIIVFLNPWVDMLNPQIPISVFKLRVKEGYYTPESLPFLSVEDKLPILNRTDERSKKNLLDVIDQKIKEKVYDLGKAVYYSRHSDVRVPTKPSQPMFPLRIPITESSLLCAGDNADTIYYQEDGKTFCFSVKALQEQLLLFGDIENPETKQELSAEFKKRIEQMVVQSDDEPEVEDVVEVVEVDVDAKPDADLAPGLLEFIMNDLNHLEGKLQERNLLEYDDDDRSLAESIASFAFTRGSRECEYCGDSINGNTNLRTIKHDKKGKYEVVGFCSFECFEHQEFKKRRK